ncbi:hypothetical protein LTS15_011118 [Exophiala xenobiotica]|nr:hypothetical protein LTS15_011118 [Exophiala xenobiotica]
MTSSNSYDLIVIGGGSSGVASARFYLDVHPEARVAILERDHSVGGVWSSERVYPGFKSQQSVRMGGFSDMPFTPRPDQVDDWDFYKAEAMATYMDQYVDKHVYSGQTLRDRIRFGAEVSSLERITTGWRIHCTTPSGRQSFDTRKVIVATGSTSEANMPDFQGQETFEGPIVHTVNLGRSKVLEQADIKCVSIVGGGKSAADHAYQAVKAGKGVHWIIRRSGKGPGAFAPVEVGGAVRSIWHNVSEIGSTRFLSNMVFFPGLAMSSWWERFIFHTTLGQWLYGKLEKSVSQRAIDAARYDDRPGARPSFSKLKTKAQGLTLDVPLGAISYEDFWDTIAHNVDVHNEDIDRLDGSFIILKDGERVPADAIICGTGFKECGLFFTREQRVELGLPHPEEWDDPEMAQNWRQLNAEAEKIVRKRYFSLRSPPSVPENLGDISPSDTPFRLYNCIAPIESDRSIAFVGFGTYPNMSLASEICAIWATAYLDGLLKLPSEEDMKKHVAYATTSLRLRCPTYGRAGNFYAFEYHPQMDRLLGELGLTSHRKGWLHDTFMVFLPQDISGLKDEYLKKYGDGKVVEAE